ncbi:MAG: DUF4491 family protein [Chlorobi bacterium]|nr:DUF4491 family protein [Chlorobiota bacterium]
MNWEGLLLGFSAFLIIGLCHPLVAKLEYYKGKKSWYLLFFPGLAFLIISFFTGETLSVIFGIIAFALFWSTIEIFKQHERVLKGQAKRNPNRNYDR